MAFDEQDAQYGGDGDFGTRDVLMNKQH